MGEFIFRPSSKGTNNITLTWKFYSNNYIHHDIAEHDKPMGATIGSKLQIGTNDFFDSLQEVVERYIAPVNTLVEQVDKHAKFLHADALAKFEELLQ